jgi:hypothetical protein
LTDEPEARPPKELIEEALSTIAACLLCEAQPSPDSHTVIKVTGVDSPEVPAALARYAVALLAGWVEQDATIAARLALQGVERRPEVGKLVDRVALPRADFDADQLDHWKRTWRNAWIAEVLTHALFVIHRDTTSDFLTGGVLALLRPHPLPKRQGLDSVAIYGEADIAVMAIGETKATAEHASTQLNNACGMFDSVEEGLYGPDLRNAIDVLGALLPDAMQAQVTEALWRKHRCYLPAIFHESQFDASASRDRLAVLEPVASRKRVVVCEIPEFEAFFDAVADAMPTVIEELVV